MKLLKLLTVAGLVIVAAAGCKKDSDYQTLPPISAVSFYHASPDAPKLSFYLNSNKIFEGDSSAYKSSIYYVNAYSGNRELSAYKGSERKFIKSFTLAEGHIYSAFLTGKYSTAEFVLLEDSLSTPAAGKAHIRFVNMSVESPALDLGVSGGASFITNKAYKANSGFTVIEGNKQYNFVVRNNGSTVDKVVLPSVNIEAGHIYTVWARGIYSATDGAALGAEITKNH